MSGQGWSFIVAAKKRLDGSNHDISQVHGFPLS
jgi:hypothetical protein